MNIQAPIPAPPTASFVWRLVAKNTSPIVTLHVGDGRMPIYCVHSIFGDVRDLRKIADRLDSRQSFYGIQVPKEKMSAAFAGSIDGMADVYVDALMAFQPEGPLALAGWSAGAIVALEMAQKLRARGRDVPLLVAFDGAPCNSRAGLRPWHPLYIAKVLANLPRWIREDANQDWSPLGLLRRLDAKLTRRFRLAVPGLNDMQTLDAGAVDALLGTPGWCPGQRDFIHAFFSTMLRHVARPYAGAVVAYETRTQPLFQLRQIDAVWRKLAADVDVVALPGSHAFMFDDPAREIILADLGRRLTAMRDGHASRRGS